MRTYNAMIDRRQSDCQFRNDETVPWTVGDSTRRVVSVSNRPRVQTRVCGERGRGGAFVLRRADATALLHSRHVVHRR